MSQSMGRAWFSPVADFYYRFYGSAGTGLAASSRHESCGPAGEARCEAQQFGEEEEKEHQSAEDDAVVDWLLGRPPWRAAEVRVGPSL